MSQKLQYPTYATLKKSAYKTPGTPEYNQRMEEQQHFYTVTGKGAIPLGSAEEEKLRQKWVNENFRSRLGNKVRKISDANDNSYNFNLNENNANLAAAKGTRRRSSRKNTRRSSRKNTRRNRNRR